MIQPVPVTQGRCLREFRASGFALTETTHARGMVLARHAHEHACLNFVLAGVYDERIEGVGQSHGPLGMVFKPALAEHANRFEESGARCLLVELTEPAIVDPRLDLSNAAESRDPRAAAAGLALWHALAAPDELAALEIAEHAVELYALALGERHAVRLETRSPRLRVVTMILHDDPRAPWTLSALAAEVGLHPSHLARAFRSRHGTTIGGYLRHLRLSAAGPRLAFTDEPIADIAMDLGFADQSHLTRAFRRAVGVTPGAFRRAMRG